MGNISLNAFLYILASLASQIYLEDYTFYSLLNSDG